MEEFFEGLSIMFSPCFTRTTCCKVEINVIIKIKVYLRHKQITPLISIFRVLFLILVNNRFKAYLMVFTLKHGCEIILVDFLWKKRAIAAALT